MTTTPPPIANFTDSDDAIQPTWLTGPVAERYRYAMSVMYRALGDAMAYAARVNSPSLAPPDALQWISADRQIDQGVNEGIDSFRARLAQWLDLLPYAGNSTGVLLAILGAVSPGTMTVRTVSQQGDWRTYLSGADPMPPGASVPVPPTQVVASPNNWGWDGFITACKRMWIIIADPDPSVIPAPTATWGGGEKYADGTAYNWAGGQGLRLSFQALAKKWKSGGCWIPQILVTYDPTLFLPTGAFHGSGMPDGKQGQDYKIVTDPVYGPVYVDARIPNVSYLAGAI